MATRSSKDSRSFSKSTTWQHIVAVGPIIPTDAGTVTASDTHVPFADPKSRLHIDDKAHGIFVGADQPQWEGDEMRSGNRTWRPYAIALAISPLLSVIYGQDLHADSTSPVMIAFSRNGSSTPRYSIWNGSAWGSILSMSSVGAEPYWVVLRDCPTRNEKACGTLDQNYDVNIQFYNGSSWSSATQVCSDADTNSKRAMDLAYEQDSGDLLLAYWQDGGSNANTIGYRTYNGSTLSGENTLSLPSTSSVRFLALYPKSNSNEILLLAVNTGNDLYASFWNGSSWSGVTTLETNTETFNEQCFAAAYESLSGHLLVAYIQNGQNNPRYRTWNGSSWSSELLMPNIGSDGRWVCLAADPASDEILFGALDQNNDINVNTWNGSSWGSNAQVETNADSYTSCQFDIVYEAEGHEALLAYVENGEYRLQYRTWNGSSWSSEQNGTDILAEPRVVQLHTGANTGEIFVAASDESGANDVEALRWTGSSMSSKTKIEDNGGGSEATEKFMISVPTPRLIVPANIPYATDFQSGVGAEWSTSATNTNGTLTTFLGRFGELNSTTLALNTKVGETYEIVFDLYIIDSWDGSSNTWGPDYVNVDVDGTQVFHETFSNRSTDSPSFKNPAEQVGNFGYGSYQDGIYRVSLAFVATSTVSNITFIADGLEAFANESWGLDNITVDLARFRNVSIAKSFNMQTTTNESYGSGLHWGDLDNDGDLDAVVTGNTARRVINNNVGQSFTASVLSDGRRQGAFVDIENDGDIDYWMSCVGGTLNEAVFENNGSGSLSNIGNLGFGNPDGNEGVAAADVDRDGWCDVVMFSVNSNWIGQHQGDPGVSTPQLAGSNDSSFGLNDSGDVGDGDFCSSGDVNSDGFLDFFYHHGGGKLFISDGDGTYTENNRGISVTTGTNDKFGSAWGDYDNDGDLDLFAPRRDANNTGYLWQNSVTWSPSVSGTFTNVTASAYVLDDSGQRSCCWGDYDNDGDLDLYVVTHTGANMLYRNEDDGTFRLTDEGTRIDGTGHDAVFVDYDNDGDLDIAITRESAATVLLENRTNNANYLKVRIVGRGGGGTNKPAVGVRIDLYDATGTNFLARRDIGVARGYGGSEPLWAHFGGVDPSQQYKLRVYLHSLANNAPYEVDVVPQNVSTTIGSTTIPQMITIQEARKRRILFWREVPNKTS
ncbi:MAG: VCBS repeat-containing protein [Phycisphaerales bacterium]|nr:VCBS repeat-containing protein [Phycisphaerales bacterium]